MVGPVAWVEGTAAAGGGVFWKWCTWLRRPSGQEES